MEGICDIIYEKFGYDRRQIPFYLKCIMPYYRNGEFRIDYPDMGEQRRKEFKEMLADDFYTFDKLKRIYTEAFPESDANDVNTYNLKLMGFVTNSDYAIQNYRSAYEYITDRLTTEDRFDITPFRNRFTRYGFYHMAFSKLKKDLEIIEYSPDKFISIRKLNNIGITKQDISDFCDDVYEYAENGTYFSIDLLCKNGFKHSLFDLGFDSYFYSNLLISDARFSWQKLWGTIIFYKGKNDVFARAFLEEIIKNEYRIDLYNMETLLKDDYGCVNVIAPDIVYKMSGADVFYDKELQVFYADQELYYREIDEMGGW
jgi:hypothetical protein